MAVIQTSTLTNSLRTRFQNFYQEQVRHMRVYDFLAEPVGDDMARFINGTQITWPYLSKMNIGTEAISEVTDKTPQILVDASKSATPTSRGEALQLSELMRIQNYAENSDERILGNVAENAVESIDWVAANQALQGGLFVRPAARASLDAGTTTHYLTEAEFAKAETLLVNLKNKRFIDSFGNTAYSALMPSEAYHDLRTGGNVLFVGQYQKAAIILNFELGSIGDFRIVRNPFNHVFQSAGLANGSPVATTLAAAANRMATTIVVSSASNISAGRFLSIGTIETGNTHYENNERVKWISTSGTTITIVGQGSNDGLRYEHANSVVVSNADTVYPVVFGGPDSLKKWWNPGTGEFGELVMDEQGLLKQWDSIGWKWYGQYVRLDEKRLVRGEYSSSLDA